MPITIQCDGCSATYRVKDSLSGKKIRCKECGDVIVVRASKARQKQRTSRSRAEEPQLPSRRPAKKGRKKATKSSSNKVPFIVGGIVVGLLVVGGGIYAVSSGGGDTTDLANVDDTVKTSANAATPTEPTPTSPPPSADVPSTTTMPSSTDTANAVATTPQNTTTPAEPVDAAPATSPPMTTAPPTASTGGFTKPPIVRQANDYPLEPDAVSREWSDRRRLPAIKNSSIEHPTAPSPVFATGILGSKVAGSESFNLASGKKIGQLKAEAANGASIKSLSPDGRILAVIGRQLKKVELLSYETGNSLGIITVEDGEHRVSKLAMLNKERLLTYTLARVNNKSESTLKLYSGVDGTLVKSAVVDGIWQLDKLAISSTGKYFARVDRASGAIIYETETLEPRATINAPPGTFNPNGAAFSEDGTEFVSVWTGNKETRVLVTSLHDGATEEIELAGDLVRSPLTDDVYVGPAIEWLPDGSGWLLFGRTVIDRATQRRTWIIDSPGLNGTTRRILLPGAVVVKTGGLDLQTGRSTPQKLVSVSWPQEKAAQALAALSAAGDARLKPGDAMNVKVEVGELKFGSPDETAERLKDVLENRVMADGMEIDDSGIELYAHYSEAEGKEMFLRQRGFLPPNTPPPAGTGIQSTMALIKLEIRLPEESKPVWKLNLLINPSTLFVRGTPDAAAIRDAMFTAAERQLTAAPIPFYIPADKSLPLLPGQTLYKSR